MGFFSVEGDRLVAYELTSGKQQWIVTAATSFQPAAGDGLLFLAADDAIAALRETDGTTAWRLPFSERLAAPLVWDNGWLVAANTSGTVFAFRASDGREIWRRDIGAQVHATPALAADRVYIASNDARLLALQVATGTIVWDRRLGGPAISLRALDSALFVGAADNYFYSIGTGKGEILWRWQTGGDVIGPTAVDDKRVYFVSLDNVLRGLSRRSGAQVWKRPLPMRPTSGPLLTGTTLLVSGLEPLLRTYATKDGASANTDVRADGVVAAPPAFVRVPSLPEPLLLYVTTDLAKGATVTAATHSVDPPVAATLTPLPNPIKP